MVAQRLGKLLDEQAYSELGDQIVRKLSTGGSQMYRASITKKAKGSNLSFAGHFGSRRQLAVAQLVTTLDLMGLMWFSPTPSSRVSVVDS